MKYSALIILISFSIFVGLSHRLTGLSLADQTSQQFNSDKKAQAELAVSIKDLNVGAKAPAKESAEAAFLAKEMPSLFDFTQEYRAYQFSELENELKDSELKVTENRLIEKSNAGELNEQDMKTLIFEMKKQDALHNLLVQHKIEVLKKKYL